MLHGAQKRKPNDYARITRVTARKRLGLHRTLGRRLLGRSCRATRLGHFTSQARQVMHRVCCCCRRDTTTCDQCTDDDAMPSTVVLTPNSGNIYVATHGRYLGHTCGPCPPPNVGLCLCGTDLGSISPLQIYFPSSMTLDFCSCVTYSNQVAASYRGILFLQSWSESVCCNPTGLSIDCCESTLEHRIYLFARIYNSDFYQGCPQEMTLQVYTRDVRIMNPCITPCDVYDYTTVPSDATLQDAYAPCTGDVSNYNLESFRADTTGICDVLGSYTSGDDIFTAS